MWRRSAKVKIYVLANTTFLASLAAGQGGDEPGEERRGGRKGTWT